jgi:hypothetical protein
MRGFIKTLIGDKRNFFVAAICILAAVILLHTPAAPLAGFALPVLLLCGVGYLAKH